jgi:hypothetical protein
MVSTEPPRRPPAAPKRPPNTHVTRADLERFADEDQLREAWDEARLREEAPPHHQ